MAIEKYIKAYFPALVASFRALPKAFAFPTGSYATASHIARLRDVRRLLVREPIHIPDPTLRVDIDFFSFLQSMQFWTQDNFIYCGNKERATDPFTGELNITGARQYNEVTTPVTNQSLSYFVALYSVDLLKIPTQFSSLTPDNLTFLSELLNENPNCMLRSEPPNHILF